MVDQIASNVDFQQLVTDYVAHVAGDPVDSRFNTPSNNPYYGTIDNWDTSAVTDMSNAFFGNQTQNFDISGWDVSNVTTMYRMFYNNDGFETNIGSWNVGNVTNMQLMFYGCAKFNVNLGNWNVSSVTTMNSMFSNNNKFNNGGSNTIKNWDVSSVTGTGFQTMFSSCAKFNQELNDWDVSNGTNFSNMFAWSDDFVRLLPDWDMSNATTITNMFTNGTGDDSSISNNSFNSGNSNGYMNLLNGGTLSIVSNRIDYVTAAKTAFHSESQTNYQGVNIGNSPPPDTTPPVITIAAGYGDADVYRLSGITTTSTSNFAVSFARTSTNKYSEQGASATDATDGSRTVTIGGDTVNTAVNGTYTVTYTASDTSGNSKVLSKTVTVTSTHDPLKNSITIKKNSIRGLFNSVCRAHVNFANSGNFQLKTYEDVVGLTFVGNNGRIGSGTTTPEVKFHSTVAHIEHITLTELFGSSDRNLKMDIKDIDSELSQDILKLEPVQYNWKKNPEGPIHYGFIAQELLKRFPNLVKYDENSGYSVDYIGIVPLIVKELQKQTEKVEQLTDESEKLQILLDAVLDKKDV